MPRFLPEMISENVHRCPDSGGMCVSTSLPWHPPFLPSFHESLSTYHGLFWALRIQPGPAKEFCRAQGQMKMQGPCLKLLRISRRRQQCIKPSKHGAQWDCSGHVSMKLALEQDRKISCPHGTKGWGKQKQTYDTSGVMSAENRNKDE